MQYKTVHQLNAEEFEELRDRMTFECDEMPISDFEVIEEYEGRLFKPGYFKCNSKGA